MPIWWKNKTVLVMGGIIVIVVGGLWWRARGKNAVEYETVAVARASVREVVEATGHLEASDDLALHFEVPGTVGAIPAREGATVKAGEILATLRLSEYDAAVAKAEANLKQKLAGPTVEDRAYYAAALDAAYAAVDEAKVETANAVAAAESALITAKNNLKLAENGGESRIVQNAYADTVAFLQNTLAKLDDGLTQADNILGIDNKLANDSFEGWLAPLSPAKLTVAQEAYQTARFSRDAARVAIMPLHTSSADFKIDNGLEAMDMALLDSSRALAAVSEVLRATQPVDTLTQSSLDSKKTTIETSRATITTAYTNLLKQKQAIADAKNSRNIYQAAYDKATRDLADAKASEVATVAAKKAAAAQARATYEGKIAVPREVDVAALRATLAEALAARNKVIIRAPIAGVVTKIAKQAGEFISAAEPLLHLLSPHYEILVDVPETDVAKLLTSTTTTAEFSVDAFGDEAYFSARLLSVEKKSTEIQDVVYYQVRLAVEGTTADYPFKAGMTVNVTMETDRRDQALVIPRRAVKTKNGSKLVSVLAGKTEVEKEVRLGISGTNGVVEVREGLNEGELVVVGKREKK